MEKEIAVNDRVKIIFSLVPDEDGYPPFDYESVWAKKLNENLWKIDNIPFFVTDVSSGDIVRIKRRKSGENHFLEVVEKCGHSTLRIFFNEESSVKEVRDQLLKMGCSTEASNIKKLISIDVPPEVSINKVKSYLELLNKQEILDIEDGCLQHP
ncbi:DUF4265 domain-containing protein [Acidovorax sp. SUPP2522]|uniref:DUF4265 domain-containing protein n=1 Tax=unclassified Acidovorax TaxID=2684926 RepID=UPI00234A32E7|nr:MULTISPECIES: DUF4265 domain-containing protein [unclassified Acidovorax]WCM96052.1 DUF4265 domain-containing protein [Acidovorax sp. GBBC 1281]WCM96509.1 DUF4265 domain-containing protein [Acidovorax sp. GBBC 1281]GKT20153.1 DUF4265 domain-containing protein [Acidovorax sp. SUPP2522]